MVTNLKLAREKRQPNVHLDPKLKEGDLVLVKDHTAKAFQPRFNPFTTEPQAIFLLLENDNLGIIN